MHLRAAAVTAAAGIIALGLALGAGSASAAKATTATTTAITASTSSTSITAAPVTTTSTTASTSATTSTTASTSATTSSSVPSTASITSTTSTTSTTVAPATTTTTTTAAPAVATTSTTACSAPATRVVAVANATQLKSALANALPGDTITLADGTYGGYFTITRSGKAAARIRLCGGPGAVLDGGAITAGYGVNLKASYWDLVGFTVTNSQKGLMLDGATFDTMADLTVNHIGDEGVHFRRFSTDNVLEDSAISDTGLRDYHYGEGVYVGSATSNWCTYTNCLPDASDRNQVLRNRMIRTTAEAVDVKEGTTGGLVQGNTFDGTGMISPSWVDVKGNTWVIEANHGRVSPRDGFLTEIAATGWGTGNVFRTNTADVQGPGYGFNVRAGNVVLCDNVATNAALGLANILCSAS